LGRELGPSDISWTRRCRRDLCFRDFGQGPWPKLFITNGPVADPLLVDPKTAPERGANGISAFIVKTDFRGFSVAQKLDKMGFGGSPTGELLLEDRIVHVENRLRKQR
jgi:alkylation response protein AidB-like acyl-CoA dehydrogenase